MIQPLEAQHFHDVIELGNLVHGNGYLDRASLQSIVDKGNSNGINSCFVAIESGRLLGFRLTYAAGQWPIDLWCTPNRWGVDQTQVGYFKCNTVASDARGKGIGGLLLNAAIGALKQQGAIAGVSHLWQQSPHNSAVRYFTKAGGVLIKEHPDRWNNTLEHPDYNCVLCGPSCHCVACEMLLIF
ncbi:GNAT family N-acetyltransferase [Shewanella sp. Choline-02u-19]|uniref:GNAT family N-acetyltransferase n=1 Tax=unclassified Shewanella TaxID=196818 RepID=UPI000C32E371|nr:MULTISPECIES: GNAT family N-acetyltransferase [unclassified Shewanella]PKH57971.1 GNAT family N-acetyltransferase [Shewanella sp. Bg11-22]PKI27480.1 GNAT family N-acetyltransferase [Shewanella sp. Choline-02u-19]